MIDMLVLRCNFARVKDGLFKDRWPDFQLAQLGVPLEQSIDRDGEVYNTRHPWESIPSSYEGMAFKIFDHRFDPLDSFYIELKASPAKIMQGHNVFGSDDFYDCAFSMLELFGTAYDIVPYLDNESWELAQIDITNSSRASTDNDAKAFINALGNVSYGQTKSRTGYDGTAYFGKKNSRLKKIKVYAKSAEVQHTIKNNTRKVDGFLLNEVYTEQLLDYSKGLIRWEVSLYHRYLERTGAPTRLKEIFKTNALSPESLNKLWHNATLDLFTALKGQEMKILNDEQVKNDLRALFSKVSSKTGKVSTSLADSAFRTYRDIRRDGWLITRQSMASNTFSVHVRMLVESGLSRAALQNMNGLTDGAEIIPFVRFIAVDFGAQFPDWYEKPEPKHVNPFFDPNTGKPRLSLVA